MLLYAARYRCLRAQHWSSSPLAVVSQPKEAVKLCHDCPSLERLDEMVDGLMAGRDVIVRPRGYPAQIGAEGPRWGPLGPATA